MWFERKKISQKIFEIWGKRIHENLKRYWEIHQRRRIRAVEIDKLKRFEKTATAWVDKEY